MFLLLLRSHPIILDSTAVGMIRCIAVWGVSSRRPARGEQPPRSNSRRPRCKQRRPDLLSPSGRGPSGLALPAPKRRPCPVCGATVQAVNKFRPHKASGEWCAGSSQAASLIGQMMSTCWSTSWLPPLRWAAGRSEGRTRTSTRTPVRSRAARGRGPRSGRGLAPRSGRGAPRAPGPGSGPHEDEDHGQVEEP
jgi:hypothetical protein